MTLPQFDGVLLGPLARRAVKLVDIYYPYREEVYITSGRDSLGEHGYNSYHNEFLYGDKTAIDLSAYSQAAKDRLGRWCLNFWPDTLELIHTNGDWDGGQYVKYGQIVGPYAAAEHVNHVHWAFTAAGLRRAELRAVRLYGTPLQRVCYTLDHH